MEKKNPACARERILAAPLIDVAMDAGVVGVLRVESADVPVKPSEALVLSHEMEALPVCHSHILKALLGAPDVE